MKRERGAAILTAMLTVTLVATFAAAALWQQWRSVEVEAAERARVQASWVLTGALDWGRLILREDAIARGSNGVDHLGEPWAVPLEEARLSTFLAAGSTGATDAGTDTENVFLSGKIVDQQSLLNVTTLTQAGVTPDPRRRAFQRLFDVLGLPAADLDRLAENMRFAADISTENRSASQAPLAPVRPDQLVWLGLSQATVTALEPYIVILPAANTPVNVNTAGAEVLYAAIDGISLADAQSIVARRAQAPFRTLDEVKQFLPQYGNAITGATLSVGSNFFEVRGRLRMDKVVVEERSLVQRDGASVKTLQRERGTVDPATLAQMGVGR